MIFSVPNEDRIRQIRDYGERVLNVKLELALKALREIAADDEQPMDVRCPERAADALQSIEGGEAEGFASWLRSTEQ